MTNTPIVNAANKYIDGLNMRWDSNTFLSVLPGSARNSDNVNDIILNTEVAVNILKKGDKGLDNGTLAVNTFYAMYVIGDSNAANPTSAIFSTNFTRPSLPSGYDMYRRIGSFTTAASLVVEKFYVFGSHTEKTFVYDAPNSLTLPVALVNTEISLALYLPPVDVTMGGTTFYRSTLITDFLGFFIADSASPDPILIFNTQVAGAASQSNFTMPVKTVSGVPTLTYIDFATNTAILNISSYTESL